MNKKLLYIALMLLSLSISAQIDFTENVVMDDTYGAINPSKVIAADVDGDGFKDVISLANGVYWYKNLDGQGNFAKPVLVEYIQVAALEFDVDVADLDGDNDLDLVYNVRSPNDPNTPMLVWAENLDGLGSFSNSQALRLLEDIGRVKVDLLDVDNDGDIDITYSDYEEIGWLENIDGNANFSNHTLLTIPSTQNFDGYSFDDFNGDNRLDLVVDYQSTLVYYLHNDDNTLTYTQNLEFAASGRYVISADIDGDSDNDVAIILLDGENSNVTWYENADGLGSFADGVVLVSLPEMATANINSINDIAFEDLDSDGALDLLFSYQPTNKMAWYKNLGSGSFGTEQIITNTAMGIKSFFAIDIDNDSKVDVITSSVNDTQVGWFKNIDGQGTFSDMNLISKIVYGINGFDKGDLDRDGDLDILLVSDDGKLLYLENTDGLGNFNNGQIVIDNTLNYPKEVYISDVDNDEDLDAVIWKHDDGFLSESSFTMFLNDGNAQFTRVDIASFNNYIVNVISVDIDGDYDLDLMGIFDGSSIFYILNNGDGTFSDMEFIDGDFNSLTALSYGDIDKDDDVDIIVSEYSGDISWFTNDGNGTFQFTQKIESGSQAISQLTLEDITGDGHKDIVYSAYSSDGYVIEYLKNSDGFGDFEYQEIIVTVNGSLYTFSFMDIDNDRDMDILAGASIIANNAINNSFLWYENITQNNADDVTYGTGIQIIEERAGNIDLFDIDDNGSLDLTVSYGISSLVWFQNFSFPWNDIIGTVRLANNVECNTNNPPFENIMVVADSDEHQYATFTDFNGLYQLLVEEPGMYTTTVVSPFSDLFSLTPESYNSEFSDLGLSETDRDFCIEPNGLFNDVEVSIFPTAENPRPGFETSYRIVYTNAGPLEESGIIRFEFTDELLNFISASEPIFNSIFGEIEFQYSDLEPFETRFIDIEMIVEEPPIAEGGDELSIFSFISGTSEDDLTPSNNSQGFKQFLVNSFDPNDITVLEGDEILLEEASEYLHYLIRFQNTGTASAININVEHQLDEKLDWQTIRMQSLSHDGRVEIIDGSMINFIFDDIHLPDSTSNEPDSHGYIAYKIKPLPNVEVGDIISGVADIYFDFNPPIITNTVNTEIVEPLSVDEFDLNKVKLYPNPAKNILELSSNQIIDRLVIVDINGRWLNTIDISATDYRLDVSNLSKGVYFLEVYSGESKSTKKFIIN